MGPLSDQLSQTIGGAPEFAIPGSILAFAGWLFWRFILRSDARERDAFRKVKEQRDYWRARTEVVEQELAMYRDRFGFIRPDDE